MYLMYILAESEALETISESGVFGSFANSRLISTKAYLRPTGFVGADKMD